MIKTAVGKRHVKGLIITLIVIQGLYVIFPLPDIWPFSNYSMFSKANPTRVASSFEFYGVTRDGREVLLNSKEAFLPFDRMRLEKGINRILKRESYILAQEKRVESVLGHLRFLPVNETNLEENIRNLLPYKENDAIEDKEKGVGILFGYLISQYEHNRKAKVHDGPPIVSMNLYLIRWDWKDMPPEKVLPETKLIYSSEYGLIEDE